MSFGGLWYGGNSEYSKSEVAEVVLYNRVLSTDERQMVEAYLSQKYDLTHPSKSKDTQINNYPFKFKILAGNANGTDAKEYRVSLLDLPAVTAKEATEPGLYSGISNGTLTSTGNDKATVKVYYGSADGGQDPTKWRRNITIGEYTEAADFSQALKGLQLGSQNFYSFMVTNRGGFPVWSDVKTFETIGGLTKPKFDPITISELKYKAAILSINVTDNGGEDPSLTLYWEMKTVVMIPSHGTMPLNSVNAV